jgi:Na+-driven multidrug efflux pump
VLALALGLDALNASMGSVLRAHLHARTALYISLATSAIHLLACLPSMRGDGPLPELGLAGFAAAMALSRLVAVALHLWGWAQQLNLRPRGADRWRLQPRVLAPALALLTHDRGVIASAASLLWLGVPLEPGRTLNLVYVNALRATGDVRWPVAVAALSLSLVMAGRAWLLGHVLGMGPIGVWLALAADEWLRGLPMAGAGTAAPGGPRPGRCTRSEPGPAGYTLRTKRRFAPACGRSTNTAKEGPTTRRPLCQRCRVFSFPSP